MTHDLATRLDALLPQTQCTRCGYPDCRRYAEAMAKGEAAINQCPPGGSATIAQLAAALAQPVLPLNPLHGVEKPREVAFILEELCIGCTKCIAACPVDAIVGAAKRMHTVIERDCTGCELCIAPCPVDCIVMQPDRGARDGGPRLAMDPVESTRARSRYHAHQQRAAERQAEQVAVLEQKRAELGSDKVNTSLAAAIARAKARKQGA